MFSFLDVSSEPASVVLLGLRINSVTQRAVGTTVRWQIYRRPGIDVFSVGELTYFLVPSLTVRLPYSPHADRNGNRNDFSRVECHDISVDFKRDKI